MTPERGRARTTGESSGPGTGRPQAALLPTEASVQPAGDAVRLPIDKGGAAALVASPRWLAKVVRDPSGCWLWTAHTTANGYGTVWLAGRSVLAHRVALVAALGRDIAPGMEVGHGCHDAAYAAGLCVATAADPCQHRRCVNPPHLTEQTPRENNLAGGTIAAAQAARTQCPRGHMLAGDNLRPAGLARGDRECWTCALDRAARGHAAVARAARALGMTRRQYRAVYGSGAGVAARVLAAVEAGDDGQQLALWVAS